MKHSAEFKAFDDLVGKVLAVPHSAIKQRIEEERRKSALKPVRPGPKRRAIKPPPASDPEEPLSS